MSRRRPKGEDKPEPYRYRITPAPPLPKAPAAAKKPAGTRSKVRLPRGSVSGAAVGVWILLLALPAMALRRLCETVDWRIVTGATAFVSLITWLMYRGDKMKAKTGAWRTPESTLHLAELAGGWPAAFIAQRYYRHKIAKREYQFIYWCIVALHQYASLDYMLGWRLSRGLYQWIRHLG